ncbi:MAG: DUF2269 family protein [Acidimicrobiales bacterium]
MVNGSGLYKLVLALHLLSAIVGFGSVFLADVFAARARARGGREGLAITEVLVDVAEHWSMWFIYAVPLFGILLVMLSEDVWTFSQTWISMSFLLWFVGVGLAHGLHFPNLRRMNALGAELVAGGESPGEGPPPQVAELEARGKRAAAVGGVLNLILVAIVFLMVWKPGTDF